MKKFRLLAAMVITVAMLCTVAFAADITFSIDQIEYNGTDDTFTVSVYSAETLEVGAMYGSFYYNPDVFEVTSVSDAAETGAYTPDNAGGYVDIYPEGITFTAGKAIFTCTVKVLDKAAAVGEAFTLDDLTVYKDSSMTSEYSYEPVTMTVKGAAAKEDPTYKAVVEPKAAFEGADGVNYTGIWVGAYTVTLNGNTANTVTVKFDETDAHNYPVETDVAGEGSIAFKIAVLGAPANAEGTPVLDGVAAVVAAE